MDFLGAMKAIEQFAYELMSWVLFFPLTIYRVIINPVRMMDYVAAETEKDETVAFASAMRPTLFLLLALTIGVLTVPLPTLKPRKSALHGSARRSPTAG